MYETLTIETDARGVATLTLNRPEKHNAMSAQKRENKMKRQIKKKKG